MNYEYVIDSRTHSSHAIPSHLISHRYTLLKKHKYISLVTLLPLQNIQTYLDANVDVVWQLDKHEDAIGLAGAEHDPIGPGQADGMLKIKSHVALTDEANGSGQGCKNSKDDTLWHSICDLLMLFKAST